MCREEAQQGCGPTEACIARGAAVDVGDERHARGVAAAFPAWRGHGGEHGTKAIGGDRLGEHKIGALAKSLTQAGDIVGVAEHDDGSVAIVCGAANAAGELESAQFGYAHAHEDYVEALLLRALRSFLAAL